MLVTDEAIPLKSVTMIYELCSRDGSPTQQSLSPFVGRRNWVRASAKEKRLDIDRDLLDIIKQQKEDINLDAMRFNPYDTKLKSNWCEEWFPTSPEQAPYPRRLEDLMDYPEAIDRWLGWLKESMAKRDADGIKAYRKEHREDVTFEDKESGELVDGVELLVTDKREDYDIDEALEKVPYILKRLHERSKDMRVHLISLVISYVKAQYELKNHRAMNKSKADLNKKRILDKGVLSMDRHGNIKGMFGSSGNQDAYFNEAYNWLLYGKDEYREDAQQLIYYSKVLGIDLKREDPRAYNSETINSLEISYITSNVNYVRRKRGNYLSNVDEALKCMPLEMADAQVVAEDDDEILIKKIDLSAKTFSRCADAQLSEEAFREGLKEVTDLIEIDIQEMFNMLNLLEGDKVYELSEMHIEDGYWCNSIGEYVMIAVGRYADQGMRDHIDSLAILHCSGALVEITDNPYVHYLMPKEAREAALKAFKENIVSYKWKVTAL